MAFDTARGPLPPAPITNLFASGALLRNAKATGHKQDPMLKPKTRIQERNSRAILEAGLEVFAQQGYRGATLDEIAVVAGLSKPNLLYYFPSKDAVYAAILSRQLETWLDPLRMIDPAGDPVEEMLAYVRRKLELSRDYPRESRLFANEVLQGASRLLAGIEGPLKALVDEKAAVLQGWMDEGRIAKLHPVHLIFSIWSLTQHYADFDVQVRAVLGTGHDPYDEAGAFLDHLFRRTLSV
jgi:TetR/AcrR family transcriptional regulator